VPEIELNGPAGRLEARYQASKGAAAPLAVVLHPHPLHGGTMNNKVAYTLFRCFAGLGFSTLRFNFRGVGRSEGVHSDGEGEVGDAMAALDWVVRENPDHGPIWLTGFSFGAWITSKTLMAWSGLDGFVLVAPGAMKYDWSFFNPCPVDGLIIQGSADDIVSAQSVVDLAAMLNSQPGRTVPLEMVEGAGHFFETQMDLLQGHVEDYVADAIAD